MNWLRSRATQIANGFAAAANKAVYLEKPFASDEERELRDLIEGLAKEFGIRAIRKVFDYNYTALDNPTLRALMEGTEDLCCSPIEEKSVWSDDYLGWGAVGKVGRVLVLSFKPEEGPLAVSYGHQDVGPGSVRSMRHLSEREFRQKFMRVA